MKDFLKLIEKKNKPNAKTLGGFFVGEKVLFCALQERFVYLCSDFVSASKLKKGLSDCDKKVQIISCGRENEDENDQNLQSFAENVASFLSDEIDGLIFLPSSIETTFDKSFLSEKLCLNQGQVLEIETLAEKLTRFGYERVDYVSCVGQFAVRGDVVDVFANGQEYPYRIEYFDDEIEKIISFDFATMDTQRSLDNIVFHPICLKIGKDNVLSLCENTIVDEPSKIANECNILAQSREKLSWTRDDLFCSFSSFDLSNCTIFSNTNKNDFENKTIGAKNYVTDFMSLKNDLQMYAKSGINTFLFAGDYFEILQEFLITNHISFNVFDGTLSDKIKVYLCRDYFSYSFSFLQDDIVGIGTDDMYKSQRVDYRKGKQNFSYLPKVGDYVVHAFYGIGRCKDIVRLKLSLFEKDYFVLEYKNGALLYLPSEQANLLSAYVGGENPKINTLGSSEWVKIKQKVKDDLKEIAISLAKIYKEREESNGYRYVRDDELERQFADAFEFELTPDQAQAVIDVDADMESTKIMDRLVCGDVGFGKTEVAFRAIFKAVYNGKQVAFLCPTTILSEQHYRSAKERMAKFGVRIEVLNRFRTEKETENIYKKLEKGEIDLLIGTHKILNSNIRFKDLGLLVLDEEQRFGVKDKEKIKQMKSDIDVLTLSATPIPRTLHMSLSGIRDISVIATPPRERLPIQTYVSAYNDQLLQDVISRELSRNGKALVLFNRVADIYQFRAHVADLLPNAKIGVAHGQMMEKELARVINDLYDDKFNVFISTTLIENGIDLPALNTLFVVDCDMLGLSQLYQIRGRIGRSDKLAYAYLTYDGGKILTEDAYKRLDAIKEFRELGSGFKIAVRDLEIRGAGNILGKEQHGHMQKVGYDMYVKLLEEVTKELAGHKTAPKNEIKMELTLDAYISEDYISSQEERIVFYNKISQIASKKDFDETVEQLVESNGELPTEVENLCKIAYLKNMASEFNVNKIKVNGNECSVYFYKSEEIIDERLSSVVRFYDTVLKFEDLPVLKVKAEGKIIDKVDFLIEIFSNALGFKKD
ncbi:MAG: transcription-repair coupling factor [Clostridia bacterium]|nr:transcription-repair coupling factor [Clostridia bacterium]